MTKNPVRKNEYPMEVDLCPFERMGWETTIVFFTSEKEAFCSSFFSQEFSHTEERASCAFGLARIASPVYISQ